MNAIVCGRRSAALRLRALCAALVAAGTFAALPVRAEAVAWQGTRFEYVADHKDLKDVLRDFGASQHVMTWISPHVEGTVTGRFNAAPQRFLDEMAGSFGVLWYFDGSVLRIYGANEARSATLGLTHASTEDLRRALGRLQVDDPRFPVRYDSVSRTAVVSGPPRFVELVTDIAHLIDHDSIPGAKVIVQRFPLHYAWATDRSISVNGRNVTVRGVASLLRTLYGQGVSPAGDASGDVPPARRDAYRVPSVREMQDDGMTTGATRATGGRPPPLPTLPGLGSGSSYVSEGAAPPPSGAIVDASVDSNPARDGGAASAGRAKQHTAQGAPTIEADSRSNSILVRDRAENMAAFGSLIESLDTRPGILEIDASIIEITDNALQELGVDWRLHSGHIDVETGNGQQSQTSNPGSLNPQGFSNPFDTTSAGVLATPAGGVLTAVIGGAGRYLLTRISAMQQTDQARITASPKVETLDNVEALMDNKQTFYVQVSGYQSADLYSVSAGVSLRVLPSIVSSASGEQIRMDVHIEDGKLTDQQVGQLPVVSNSTIDTQALINEGDSLLIAGYSVDQDDHTQTAVPLLSKIPLIGGLFKYRKHQGQRFQRLFLLTPRVLSAAAGGAAGNGNGPNDATGGVGGTMSAPPPVPGMIDGAGVARQPPEAMNMPSRPAMARVEQIARLPAPQPPNAVVFDDRH
ncbi:EscC/YscC/HrcC family type III secretion system outer membrane ring protein [bacterium M00.F.Ca.ET.228.01.1.1]|uniref:type III secretion system outer membrane ring subunit SctC n=1 Tax=Paraburkholderia phenoliruptrix TaxID=252970 RepID=UPI001092D877|nr:type III secretion system outer membrane ring subunit SctC [Paraburkholderia phenoliruptrix]TGP41536.1 EscC/YscC/HrcC family type III secretion system outer membrane ring protein [bacterium M00.F.Ca.ET.228.01.1.1]TGR98194.1 EscC/YscC/HrcC family type III secretion system outer membrane ring protein [bacterium M00.F.Ca.ET.191.01.1.1]TGU02385.1 EscC/YscC/HrcC family type III secretion system outer membrane ring protein [bacterium M00.F.Ca.ET.155.01.1.1]MBW0447188.1 type III secretion system ou